MKPPLVAATSKRAGAVIAQQEERAPVLRVGGVAHAAALDQRSDRGEPIGVRIGQRTQQDGVHDAEDGRVGANRERRA